MNETGVPLTIALPKGRLLKQVQELFAAAGLGVRFDTRKLVARDDTNNLECFLVKNSDLPTYVKHGIAGLGICGGDVLYESGTRFVTLGTFPFGSTKICLAARKDYSGGREPVMKVATKYTRFTRNYFHARGIPVQIIKLNGSVELAPLLGLAPYIVDLVETGSTLRENNLAVLDELDTVEVHLIANPAYYKLHYKRINPLIELLLKEKK